MKHLRPVFLTLTVALSQAAQAQRIDVKSWNHIYTDVVLAVGDSSRHLQAMIDTGCTTCVIDSTYAVDSCGIDIGGLKTTTTNRIYQVYRTTIDSICFCGTTYRQMLCIIIDLKGLFRQYAPRFIVGANILKTGAWMVDTERQVFEPYDVGAKAAGTVLRWKCPKRFHHADAIFLNGKVEGRKAWFLFDTGARHNKLPQGVYTGPTETMQKETAHIGHPMDTTVAELCRNVGLSIGRSDYVMDFFIHERRDHGLLNIRLLQGRPFILDYKKKRLVILYQRT